MLSGWNGRVVPVSFFGNGILSAGARDDVAPKGYNQSYM